MVHPRLTPGLTWWLTGLPAAGKTTLAEALASALQADGRPACVLDGDELRHGLCRDLGFSDVDRAENMRRVAEVAALLNRVGMHAIVALVSPTRDGRDTARGIVGAQRFIEVHVATPLAVCRQRDPKGLYARAAHDQTLGLTGVQAPYEPPLSPELVIDTSRQPVGEAVALLIASLQHKESRHP